MAALNLDRDTALRIALAAHCMPDVELFSVIEILDMRLGAPLNIEKLSRITVTDLKTGLGSVDGEEDGEDLSVGLDAMKLAVRVLWRKTDEGDLPQAESYQDGDIQIQFVLAYHLIVVVFWTVISLSVYVTWYNRSLPVKFS